MRSAIIVTMTAFMAIASLVGAQAQTTPAAPSASTPSASTPSASTPPNPVPAAPATPTAPSSGLTARPIAPQTHHRMTMAQRFEAANTTHDGHLTLAQAKSANMTRVYKNFDQIDTAKKGYVTIDDLHAFNRARRHARSKSSAASPS
jgi:hypothetical protein